MANPEAAAPAKPKLTRTAWRYHTLWLATQRVTPADLDAQMDAFGAEGWELVGLQASPTGMRCVFKRPATAEEVAETLARPKRALRVGPDREEELEKMRELSARREAELREVERERMYQQNAGRMHNNPEPAGAYAAANGAPAPPVGGFRPDAG